MYLAWQRKDDPTRFLHSFIFANAAAQTRHGQTDAVNASDQFIRRSWLVAMSDFNRLRVSIGEALRRAQR